jgi:hypothetical protein
MVFIMVNKHNIFIIAILFHYIGRYQDDLHVYMALLKLKACVSKASSPGTVIQQERIARGIIGVQVHPHACEDLKEDLNASIKHFPFQRYLLL